jgi:hypothetical protein
MKRLACWVGRHNWTTHVEHGESYRVCSACGKIPKGPGNGPKGSEVFENVDTTGSHAGTP